VLTHHLPADLAMAGGTTFHFVTDGAGAAVGGHDVRLAGGGTTIRDRPQAGPSWSTGCNIAVVPMLLGFGEWLFDGDRAADYRFARTGAGQSMA
jgi:hypothetical protein